MVKVFKALNYRDSINKYFGYDPLKCKKCNGEMLLCTINYFKDGVLRTKRYLGAKGYIATKERRIYDNTPDKFFKVDLLGQVSFL